MAIASAETLTSYVLGRTPWRRDAIHVEAHGYSAIDWDARESALSVPPLGGSDVDAVLPTRILLERELPGDVVDESASTCSWFNQVHVLPRAFTLGLVVSTYEARVELYNAYRWIPQTLDDWTNFGGPGISLIGIVLPETLSAYASSGQDVAIEITTAGEPIVDSHTDFEWTVGTVRVLLTFTRVIPFATRRGLLIPEDDFFETMEWRTSIITAADRTEQRAKLRKNPRHTFEHVYLIDEGLGRAELDMLLANLQHRLFAVGVWEQEVRLVAAIAEGDTALEVSSTSTSDFRVGGFLAVFVEGGDYDVRGIAGVAGTTITLSNGVEHAYLEGARVVPMRSGYLPAELQGRRWPVNLTELSVAFEVVDNDVDLADTTGQSTYAGKLLLDGFNAQEEAIPDGIVRRMTEFDGLAGLRYRESDDRYSLPTTVKSFFAQGATERWRVRRLLHAIAGRLTSFYLPTFREDLELVEALVSGETSLVIAYAGYTDHGLGAMPKRHVRVELANGTTYDREIIDAAVGPDGETEILTVGAAWPANVAVDAVERLMFVTKVRFATDSVRVHHRRGGTAAKFSAPVQAVLE